jgi:hypothetical protein
MQQLNRLWQVVNAASTVRDLAQQSKTYHFAAGEPITFYLRTENADVRIIRWQRPLIEMTITMQGAFGWRVLTEQDEAGIYVAAKRRNLVGSVAGGAFEVYVPQDTYVILKLARCNLTVNSVHGEMHLPPNAPLKLESSE